MPAIRVGEKGLVLVEYLGEVTGKWKGPETCQMYPFGRGRKFGYVDMRDWSKMKDWKLEDGAPVFAEALA